MIEALGMRFSAAKLWQARALFDPADPGAAPAAEAAAEVFRDLGAITLLRQLEPVLGAPASDLADDGVAARGG